MVAKENGHKGRWFLKEDDRYEKWLLWRMVAMENGCYGEW